MLGETARQLWRYPGAGDKSCVWITTDRSGRSLIVEIYTSARQLHGDDDPSYGIGYRTGI